MATIDERIEKLEEKKEQLNQQVKQLKARKSQEERKARTKRLIEIGAEIESIFGKEIDKNEIIRWAKNGKYLQDTNNIINENDLNHFRRLAMVGSLVEKHTCKITNPNSFAEYLNQYSKAIKNTQNK